MRRRLSLLLIAALLPFAGLTSGAVRAAERQVLLILGDSITAGYGLEEPETQAYPARLQARIDEAGLPWKVVGAGLSGETTAGGLRRIDWLLRRPPDLFLLALGGNDGLRGIPPENTLENLKAILARVHAKCPATALFIAGMEMPSNMGEDYTQAYRKAFPEAAKAAGATLIPFLLAGVGGVPSLNQADAIHPNPAGHQRIADLLWEQLRPLFTKTAPR